MDKRIMLELYDGMVSARKEALVACKTYGHDEAAADLEQELKLLAEARDFIDVKIPTYVSPPDTAAVTVVVWIQDPTIQDNKMMWVYFGHLTDTEAETRAREEYLIDCMGMQADDHDKESARKDLETGTFLIRRQVASA